MDKICQIKLVLSFFEIDFNHNEYNTIKFSLFSQSFKLKKVSFNNPLNNCFHLFIILSLNTKKHIEN